MMKGAVLALFCAVALVSAELNENGCPINPYVDILKSHPNCNKFYQCHQGELLERSCAADLVFNEETQQCDWAENVACGDRKPPVPETSEEVDNDSNSGGDVSDNGNSSSSEENNNKSDSESGEKTDSEGGNGNPKEAREICAADGSDGVLVAHENCNQFYKCSEGLPVALDCPLNLLYNPKKEQCDWPENVKCKDRNVDREDGNSENGNGGHEDSGTEEGGHGGADGGHNGGGNSNAKEAREICAAEGSDGVLVAHENCHQFYKCSEGLPVALDCPLNLLYNPKNEQCDWPENINCGGRSVFTSFNKHFRFAYRV